MNRNVLLVALGSMLGGVARYTLSLGIAQWYVSEFPYGTFVVNIVGCFLVGAFYGSAERWDWFSPDLRLMLTAGFCGGFTTFSSFAYENVRLLQDRDLLTFGTYAVLSVVLGLLAAFGGLCLARA